MKQIFPKEIIDDSVEVHQFKHSSKSKIIYVTILFFIISGLISLPFIHVDVYTSGRGIIKPNKERLILNSVNTGNVILSNLKNNIAVSKGEVLLMLNSEILDEKLDLVSKQIHVSEQLIFDLNHLSKNRNIDFIELKSPKYQKEYLLFQQNKQEKTTRYELAKKTKERNQPLLKKEVISKSEFDKIKSEFDLAKNDLIQIEKQQQNIWQSELTNFSDELLKQKSKHKELLKNKQQLTIKAPISGTLFNSRRISVGSFLNAGETFAEISPNTKLIVECYIPPSDIGLLKKGNKVSFQVDAYNYNQWGIITGKIVEINDDMELINNNPMFKITCSLDQQTLHLKNGFEGKLKKGMTLSTQFRIAERSLFDLLYDKADDWLNPSQNEIAENLN